jgi:hypothetical protein
VYAVYPVASSPCLTGQPICTTTYSSTHPPTHLHTRPHNMWDMSPVSTCDRDTGLAQAPTSTYKQCSCV